MSGPLHAIMRGQYAQSFQSADERARNRAAAAVVLGTVLIGGAIYVVTKYGNLSMMQFSDANSVTTKDKERIQGYLQQIDELKANLSSETNSLNESQQKASELESKLAVERAELKQKASELESKLAVERAELKKKSDALESAISKGAEHEARAARAEQNVAVCAARADTAETAQAAQKEHSEKLVQENMRLHEQVNSLTTDAQKTTQAQSSLQYAEAQLKTKTEALIQSEKEIAAIRKQNQELLETGLQQEKRVRDARDEAEEAKRGLDGEKTKSAGLTEQLNTARAERDQYGSQITVLKQNAQKAEERAGQLKGENDELTKRVESIAETTTKLNTLTAEAKSNNARILELEKALSNVRTENDELQKVKIRVGQYEDDNKRLVAQVDDLQRALGDASTTIKSLEAEAADLKGASETLEKLQVSLANVHGALGEALSQQSLDRQSAVQANVKAEVHVKLAESTADAARGLAEVVFAQKMDMVALCAKTHELLVQFMNRSAQYTEWMQNGAQALVAERAQSVYFKGTSAYLDTALTEARAREIEGSANRQKEIDEADGRGFERGKKSNEEAMAEMRIRIVELKKYADDARAQMSTMQTKHARDKKALERAVREKHTAAEEYRQKSDNLFFQVNQLNLEYGQLQNAYNLAVQERDTAVFERDEVQGDLDTEKAETKRLADENKNLTDEKKRLEDENTRLSSKAENNADAFKRADDQLKHVQSVSDGKLRELTQAQQALGSVQGELTTAQQRVAGLEQNVAALQGQLQAIGPAVDAARNDAAEKTTKKTARDTLQLIIDVLMEAGRVGDGNELKISFEGVLKKLVEMGIYDQAEFAQMNHEISSAIELAVQSSSQRYMLAEQALVNQLACTAAVVSAQPPEEDMA
jgi:chromosome segregation ATPase